MPKIMLACILGRSLTEGDGSLFSMFKFKVVTTFFVVAHQAGFLIPYHIFVIFSIFEWKITRREDHAWQGTHNNETDIQE